MSKFTLDSMCIQGTAVNATTWQMAWVQSFFNSKRVDTISIETW